MSFTFDFAAAPTLSYVRLLMMDTDANKPIFNDDEVNAFLFLESSQGLFISGPGAIANGVANPPVPQVYSVYRAAALGLDAMASNKARLAAISQILDVKLGHDAAAAALHKQAEAYRETERMAGHFAIAEMVVDQFSARQRVQNQLLRLFQG